MARLPTAAATTAAGGFPKAAAVARPVATKNDNGSHGDGGGADAVQCRPERGAAHVEAEQLQPRADLAVPQAERRGGAGGGGGPGGGHGGAAGGLEPAEGGHRRVGSQAAEVRRKVLGSARDARDQSDVAQIVTGKKNHKGLNSKDLRIAKCLKGELSEQGESCRSTLLINQTRYNVHVF